jgi:hypothetical protein
MMRQNKKRDFAVMRLGHFGSRLALRLMERRCY